MSNFSNISIMDVNYNITKILETNPIDQPALWISNLNIEMNTFLVPTLLILFGIVLFLISRETENTKDSTAGVYSGLATSVLGTILLLIDATAGTKLISWQFLTPIYVLTAIFIYLDNQDRRI